MFKKEQDWSSIELNGHYLNKGSSIYILFNMLEVSSFEQKFVN